MVPSFLDAGRPALPAQKTMISGQTRLGRILRTPLALIPRESQVHILRGPLRGKKWIVGAATHGCWTGTYEAENLACFAAAIKPGDCVYDVGANVGVYTLTASLAVGPTGHVYAFEPLERNLRYLRRHVALNRLQNCHILGVAVSDVDGPLRFSAASWEHTMGRLSTDGELEVTAVTLDGCTCGKEALPLPNVLKIDVEGAEVHVLRGANRVLGVSHPILFIETHGDQQHANCCALLKEKGYRLKEGEGRITAIWRP
jgi:FkbM family methyltransferase